MGQTEWIFLEISIFLMFLILKIFKFGEED